MVGDGKGKGNGREWEMCVCGLDGEEVAVVSRPTSNINISTEQVQMD